MKIVLVTIEEPFYMPRVVETIAQSRGGEIAACVILQPFSPKSGWSQTIRQQLMLLGMYGFIRQGLRFVWSKVRRRSVRSACERMGIAVFEPANINDGAFLEVLRGIAPDVIVSLSASQIFRKQLLALPVHGCINVHSAPLPRYRGMLPSFWVLANGERETAVTVHYMDEQLDNGDIILQRPVAIAADETQESLLKKTKAAAAEAVIEALRLLEEQRVERKPNRAEDATYFSFPTADDVRRFRASGKRLF